MEMERKKFIALKTLRARAEQFRKNVFKNEAALVKVSQLMDTAPEEIRSLFNQMVGKQDVTWPQEKFLETAWFMCKAALRDSFLEHGLASTVHEFADISDETGIPELEMKEFLRETICEIVNECFA